MLRATDKKSHVGRRLFDVVGLENHLAKPPPSGSISLFSTWSVGGASCRTLAGAAWPSANRALFIPFRVPYPVTIDQLECGTGTLTTGNFDLGIYDAVGNRMVSTGSTAKTTASSDRFINVTDTYLKPGLYYLAMVTDGTQNYSSMTPVNLGLCKLIGMREMATAFPLPTTATYATVSSNYIPLVLALTVRETRIKSFPVATRWPPLNVITPMHVDASGEGLAALGTAGIGGFMGTSAAAAIGTANLILVQPFTLHEMAVAQSMSYIVGAAQVGNVDLGIYDGAGNRLVSTGTTGQGAINTFQNIDITDTLLGPGLYFMAIQFSSSTGTLFRLAGANDEFHQAILPNYEIAAGVFGLPTTLAGVVPSTAAAPQTPVMGVHFSSLI